jgi:aminoglycoside phosphotransferase (APT) family kinase protein
VLGALKDLVPDLSPEADPRVLPRGYGSESWLVATNMGPVLVKVAIRWPDGELLPNAAEAARLAAGQGVRTPQAVAIGDPHPILGGRAYSVWEYLEGTDADEAFEQMDRPTAHRFFARLGTTLAQLHALSGPHYARTVTSAVGQPSWADAVAERLGRLEDRYVEVGLDFGHLPRRARTQIAELADELSGRSVPALVHGDVYPDNLLVAPDGSPVLLDFERASYADAGFEFVKPTLFIFPGYPEARSSLLEAYLAASPGAELERRIELAVGLDLVWGIPFFHLWNDTRALALYQSELEAWLR